MRRDPREMFRIMLKLLIYMQWKWMVTKLRNRQKRNVKAT